MANSVYNSKLHKANQDDHLESQIEDENQSLWNSENQQLVNTNK